MTLSARDERSILTMLGELRGELHGIKQDIDDAKQQAVRNEENTSTSRQRIYDKLDEIGKRVTMLESTVTVVGGVQASTNVRLDTIEPKVEAVRRTVHLWSIRGGFILTALAATAGFVWWVLSSNWRAVVTWLLGLQGPTP